MAGYRNHEASTREFAISTNDYTITDFLEVASYHLERGTMQVYDTVWGDECIGGEEYDELLLELARHPLFQRLQAVEQLTLPATFSTIPNSAYLSRWQHVWGSLVFVRKMTRNDDRFSERDRIVMQLRTLFSDVGQTAFSHLGDWIFQDNETTEDLHDQELRALLENFGIDELLDQYNLTLDETVFPDKEDWVECPSPDLCVDRVDYGMREILRWMSPPSPLHMYKSDLHHPETLFTINDDAMLEIKNEEFARHFAHAYNLLPTEHWAQPVHRLQLQLMQTAVKYAMFDGYDQRYIPRSDLASPRDQMYGIDANFFTSFQKYRNATLSDIMRSIGLAQRQIYTHARKDDLQEVLRMRKPPVFPDPLQRYTWQSEQTGLVAPQVEIETVDTTDASLNADGVGLTFGLPAMKPRSIDPLVSSKGGERLSEDNPDFTAYLEGQTRMLRQHYEARLLINKDTSERLFDISTFVDNHWRKLTEKPRDIEKLKVIVGHGALFATLFRFDEYTDDASIIR